MSSIIKVDAIQKADGTIPTAKDLGLNIAGSVLQVVNVTTNGTSGFNNGVDGSYVDLFSATITPKFANSKILVTASVTVGTTNWGVVLRILQNGSTVSDHYGLGGDQRTAHTFATVPYAANDDETSTASYCGLFSPATTSPVTYKIQGGARSSTNWAFNRSQDSPSTNSSRSRGISSIVLQEIAQ
jgi:hypothetical protein